MHRLIIAFISSFIIVTNGFAQEISKPNIILIVADDLGYGDITYENKITSVTPHLNSLAKEGMRLTDFYGNAPVASPTRTALLTGRYQQRSGIETALKPGAQGLPPSEITIAEYLKREGYATAVYGKWHVGTVPEANPVQQGFDEFRGHLNAVDYNSHIGPWGNPDWWINDRLQNEEGYSTDLITNHTINFINEHPDQPFFVYVPFSNIHFPWCTPDDPKFWHEGVNYYNSIDTKLGPHSPANVTRVVRRMIYELDRSVGRIVYAVKKNNLEEKTFIFFCSDNGGYIHYEGRHKGQISDNGPLRGQKGELYEGGIRVPAIAWWPGQIQAGSESDEIGLTMDLLPTFLKMAGIMLPAENSPHALDGISMDLVLFENQSMPERTVFWRRGDGIAVRQGPWKMLLDKTSTRSSPELYNLSEDIGEQNEVSKQYPKITSQLKEAIVMWEKDVGH